MRLSILEIESERDKAEVVWMCEEERQRIYWTETEGMQRVGVTEEAREVKTESSHFCHYLI